MNKSFIILPGAFFCFLISAPSWLLGRALPIVGGAIFAIIIGIIVAQLFPKIMARRDNGVNFDAGVKFTSKKLLQLSIILLGFNMNFYNIFEVGRQSLFVMLFTLLFAFLTAYFVGKILSLHGNISTLIGVGTAICGGSAIAAVAPTIRASEEDIGQAISTIFLFNIIAALIFPFLGRIAGLSDMGFGMWAGTAINDTSSVVAAGATWSGASGNDDALNFATIVKLTRTLMIIPIAIFLAFYTSHKTKQANSGDFKFTQTFPWFVLLFVAAALINTFTPISANVSFALSETGKFVIIMAMAAIGLNTNLRKLIANGFKSIALGLSCWFVVALTSLVVQRIINIY